MWTLVFIYFYDVTPYVELVSVHNSMIECFHAREALAEEVGGSNGYYPPGQQGVCVYNEIDP